VTSNCKKHKECKCYIVDEPDFNTGDGEQILKHNDKIERKPHWSTYIYVGKFINS
jgi:hypothetical protein